MVPNRPQPKLPTNVMLRCAQQASVDLLELKFRVNFEKENISYQNLLTISL
jgi:hypothetical protein